MKDTDRFESSQGEKEKNSKSLCGDMEADEALEALGLRMVGVGRAATASLRWHM